MAGMAHRAFRWNTVDYQVDQLTTDSSFLIHRVCIRFDLADLAPIPTAIRME